MDYRSDSTSYDQIPYPSLSYSQTHPDRLAVLATLLGMEPAPVERCRVLDVGCAVGGNLIPMAYGLPDSEFVGIDYSARQISDGREIVDRLGLSNVTLEHMDIMNVPEAFGKYDYIIAHGIYSWVPDVVRDGLLQLCRRHLATNGVAFVSYNTYPGWHMLSIVRDAMNYHTRVISEPAKKAAQARAFVNFMANSITADKGAFGAFLDSYNQSLTEKLSQGLSKGDALLLHDELEVINEPVYFHQFAAHANRHGLQFLSESNLSQAMLSNLQPEVAKQLEEQATDLIELQQYLDFFRNRTFRQTLLCHKEISLNRGLRPETIMDFLISTRARPESDEPELGSGSIERFRGSDGAVFATDHPLTKSALSHLAQAWPRALPFEELAKAAAGSLPAHDGPDMEDDKYLLAANILRAYSYSNNLVELELTSRSYVTTLSERPVSSLVARWQAAHGHKVTNLRHERVDLGGVTRLVLGQLDGSHARDEILDMMIGWHYEGAFKLSSEDEAGSDQRPVEEILADELDLNLRFLTRAALLIQ